MKSRKSFNAVEWKDDQLGSFRARIATLNVVDKDGDVTLAGAFPEGKEIVISAYGHTSWYGSLPIGKGVVHSNAKEAWVEGQLFTDTTAGADSHKVLKALGAMGEWSYGYDVRDSSSDAKELESYPGAFRVLKELDVYEASPVLLGAGVNTATESIKASARARALGKRLKQMTADPNTLATIAQIDLLADGLDELVDTLMDEFGIPDPDEIVEGEPEENEGNYAQGSDMPKGMTFAAQAKDALTAVQSFAARVKALADLRAKEGRVLSAANRDRLSTLLDALTSAATDVQGLLESTDPDAGKSAEVSNEWLRFQAQLASITRAA